MYPQLNKEQMPSAPSFNSEYANTPKYVIDPQNMSINCPQYPSPPPNVQPTQMIVIENHGLPPLGVQPVELTCPFCKVVVTTSVEEESSKTAYLCCMLLFIVGCVLCSCLPFCMDNFKNYKHTCPRCKAFIGAYQP